MSPVALLFMGGFMDGKKRELPTGLQYLQQLTPLGGTLRIYPNLLGLKTDSMTPG